MKEQVVVTQLAFTKDRHLHLLQNLQQQRASHRAPAKDSRGPVIITDEGGPLNKGAAPA